MAEKIYLVKGLNSIGFVKCVAYDEKEDCIELTKEEIDSIVDILNGHAPISTFYINIIKKLEAMK